MRTRMMFVPLLLGATPAVAQTPAPAPSPAAPDPAQIQRVLSDPAMTDRLARTMEVLSKVFMDLPAGELQAAIEGRKPTRSERRLKVRDMARRDDPNAERAFREQMANARPMIEHSMKALATALPGMMQGMQQAAQALERAAANMPDPTYPKR